MDDTTSESASTKPVSETSAATTKPVSDAEFISHLGGGGERSAFAPKGKNVPHDMSVMGMLPEEMALAGNQAMADDLMNEKAAEQLR